MKEEIIKRVLSEISNKYSVSIKDLKGRSRKSNINKARIEAFVILREKHDFIYSDIGKVFNRCHSTIVILYAKYRAKNPFNDKDIAISFLIERRNELGKELLALDNYIYFLKKNPI